MIDRHDPAYEPRFDLDYEFGQQAELFVSNIVASLGTERVEIKHDARFVDTGNVYIETQCLRRGRYRPSGISVTEAELWVFVLEAGVSCVVVSTDVLKHACRTLWRDPSNHVACSRGSHPTRGLRVPLTWLLRHGARKAGAA